MTRNVCLGAVLGLSALFTLACGGGGSKFGSVEFTTYKSGRSSVTFNGGGTATRKWSNMSGDPVKGEWTQNGEEIEIQWDPNATNFTGRVAKFKQMGPCSMAQYYTLDADGKTNDDEPRIFEQVKPLCNTVQVR